MDRYTLSFSVCRAGTGPLDRKQWHNLVQEFERDTGLSEITGQYHVDIPSPQYTQALNIVEKWTQAGLGHFCMGLLRPESKPDPAQWRRVSPPSMLPWDKLDYSGGTSISCNACRVMADSHFRYVANPEYFKNRDDGFHNHICVSQAFVDCVRDNKLEGLEFIYIPDVGKYAARQWYVAVPTHSLGRGVDHPWADPIAYYQYTNVIPIPVVRKGLFAIVRVLLGGSVAPPPAPIPPDRRAGIFEFYSLCMRPGAGFGDIGNDRLFLLFDPIRLRPFGSTAPGVLVRHHCRVMRDHLPRADFAYYGSDPWLFVSPRAYEILTSQGILSHNDGDPIQADEPVDVLDELPPDAEPLDGRLGPMPPPPHWRPEHLAGLRASADEFLHRHQGERKPRWEPHLNRIAASLKQLRRDEPDSFNEGITVEDLDHAEAELGMPFPGIWRRILRFSSPIEFCEMDFTSDIPNRKGLDEFRDQLVRYGNGRAPGAWLPFGYSAAGDYWVLDLATCDEAREDCRVLLVSHEGYFIERAWPSIPHFLDEAIEQELSPDDD